MTNEFTYGFVPAKEEGAPPLLLLHGTGGDENDLLQLGTMGSPNSALLSPRGRVLENGMPASSAAWPKACSTTARSGIVLSNSRTLLEDARRGHGIARPIAVGYSNGANVAAAVMLLCPGTFAGAALLRAMVPLSDPPHPDLSGVPVLIASGKIDPIVPVSNSAKLAAMLREAGADVSHQVLPIGHQLSQGDIALVRGWLTRVDVQQPAATR